MKIIEIEIPVQNHTALLTCYIRSEKHRFQENPDYPWKPRPCMLVVPGGGYHMNCERESEPIALAFAAKGYTAAVLRYSVDHVEFPIALMQLAFAVNHLRKHAKEYSLDPDRVMLFGGSAGGHLAGCLGVFWNHPFLREKTGLTPEEMRPNGLILAYPVVTAGPKAHPGSFENLLCGKVDDPDLRDFLSLEKQVTGDMPPVFLWATLEDSLVPPENSLLLACAMQAAGVKYELHIYPTGDHGASLCTQETLMTGEEADYAYMAGWFDEALRFLKHI